MTYPQPLERFTSETHCNSPASIRPLSFVISSIILSGETLGFGAGLGAPKKFMLRLAVSFYCPNLCFVPKSPRIPVRFRKAPRIRCDEQNWVQDIVRPITQVSAWQSTQLFCQCMKKRKIYPYASG